MLTPSVLAAQEHYYGRRATAAAPERDPLTDDEREFIAARDSFYVATVTETGWPYVQHRGGKPGFLRVLGPTSLAFADFGGNRQMLSTGNLAANDRVALFLMDYPQRTRLKILGHARVEDARQHPELVQQLSEPDVHRIVSVCSSLKSSRSTGIAPNTSRNVTPPKKFRNWLRRSTLALPNSKPN